MKKYLSLILVVIAAAVMFTSCGNKNNASDIKNESTETLSETENSATEEITEQTTEFEMTFEENAETYSVAKEVETEAVAENNSLTVLSEDDLSSDTKKFLEYVNSYRQKEGAEAVVSVKELNECAEKYIGEVSNNFSAFLDESRADGSEFSTLLDEEGISYTACDKIVGMTVYYDITGTGNMMAKTLRFSICIFSKDICIKTYMLIFPLM